MLQTNKELRTVIFAFNLKDQLFESDVKDRNPLKDKRLREALYSRHRHRQRAAACDAWPVAQHGAIIAPAIPGYVPALDERLPFDLDAPGSCSPTPDIQRLFFQMNCQSDGLVNEEEFCQAVAAMWAVPASSRT